MVYTSALTLGGSGVVAVLVVRTNGARDRSGRGLGMEHQAPMQAIEEGFLVQGAWCPAFRYPLQGSENALHSRYP